LYTGTTFDIPGDIGLKNKIIFFWIVLFLNISLEEMSFSDTCYPIVILACGSTAGSSYYPPYSCLVPEAFCPPNQYCKINYIPGYNGCFQCPANNPNCGAATSNQRPPKKRTKTKDPVDIFSGEVYFSSTDFSYEGQGPKLSLYRQYSSFSLINGMFGYGWRTDWDINLTQDSSGNVTIYDSEGTQFYFTNNSGSYINPSGNFFTLTQNTDSTYTLTDKYGKAARYGINGRLNSITDRNGDMLTFSYNPSVPGGTYIQDATGRKIVLNIDSNGHIVSAVDPAGKTYQYGYDVNGNLVSITDPTAAVTNYSYDANHRIVQFTNANGHNTYYRYDSQGRLVMNWRDGNVNKTTLTYEANNTTIVTDSLGKNTTYVFNDTGLLISQTDPLGNVTQKTWDRNMDQTSMTDVRNNVTNFLYDTEGNLIQITDPLGKQTNIVYTPNFNLISSKTDPLGHVTNYVYDIKGNLTGITDALGRTRSFNYDQYGNVITATDTRGNKTNFIYDALGHVIQKTDALGNAINYTYE
jgi:YD repeat-containing protein